MPNSVAWYRRAVLVYLTTRWGVVVSVRAELAVTAAVIGGWLLLTYGVASLTAPIAWAFSGGLLLLSLCGWRFLWRLVRDGLYELTRGDDA